MSMNFLKSSIWIVLIVLNFMMDHSFASDSEQLLKQRALIAVINLHTMTHKKGLYESIYREEEKLAQNTISRHSTHKYFKIVYLTQLEATRENFLTQVKRFQNDPNISAIDVIFYLHGHSSADYPTPEICFVSENHQCYPSTKLSDDLIGNSKLRALYSDACHGHEQNEDMIVAGFKVVAGSKGTDSNFMLDMKRFLKKWTQGESFQDSIHYANQTRLGKIMDRLGHGDSEKIVLGNGAITIND